MKTTIKNGMTLLLVAITASLFGQVSIGAKAGIYHSNVAIDGIDNNLLPNTKGLTDFSGGVISEIMLGNNFGIQPELNYEKSGFQINEGLDIDIFNVPVPIGLKAKVKVDYLTMPILAKYKIGSGPVKGYISAGPNFRYAMKGEVKTFATVLIDIPVWSQDINFSGDNVQRMDIGGIVGAGVSFTTGPGQLFIDARYNHGFTQVDNFSFADLKMKNTGMGINIGYMMPLTKKKIRA